MTALESARTRARPAGRTTRAGRLWLAGIGGAWALFSTPLVAGDWGAKWIEALSLAEPWRSLRDVVDEPYIVHGALGGLSFLAIGLALLPDLRRAGWGGTALAWLVLAGALVTPVSYLSTPVDAPTHALWGSEGPLLIVIGIVGVLAAITAGPRWPLWARILLGCTLPVLIAGLLATGYYPHGPLATLALEAVALIAAAPRATAPASAAADADEAHSG
ncbi:hypothetical protein [Agrococcus sp. HG114]|uniref:hypothetical protein n=1 Tax=Agrococcus sp. HG114 TaxID=2969757 RepID=UPI00215B0E92|nr:hypothetical protein [Agrococcus sp. HG114]MCR8670959.1 hypothetical protein [Agrococcus sp. HG114]